MYRRILIEGRERKTFSWKKKDFSMYRPRKVDDERKITPKSGDFLSNRREMYRPPGKLMEDKFILKPKKIFHVPCTDRGKLMMKGIYYYRTRCTNGIQMKSQNKHK